MAVLGLALVVYTCFIARTTFVVNQLHYFTLVDDAMISMRFARHLAAGHGLVWNIGEPPVEGFTSLTWVILLALLHRLPIAEPDLPLVVMFGNAVVLLAVAATAARIARQLTGAVHAGTIAAALTAFYYPLAFWTLRGMEVGLITLLIALGCSFALAYRQTPTWANASRVGLVIVLAMMTRPDAVPQVIVLVVFVAAVGGATRIRHAIALAATVAATFGALSVWRLDYFGSWLPNTYYLKLTGTPLVERAAVGVRTLLANSTPELIVALATLCYALRFRAGERIAMALPLALFGVQCAYSLYVGGDYMEADVGLTNRFVVQGAIPLFAVTAAVLPRVATRHADWHGASAGSLHRTRWAAAVVLIAVTGVHWWHWARTNAPQLSSDVWRARAGLLVRASTQPQTVVAAHAVGQIGYFSERPMVDLLGKNDPVIAHEAPRGAFRPGHNKWDYARSIGLDRPDVIADEWGELGTFMQRSGAAYQRLANGVWVRRDSARVDRSLLSAGFRGSRKDSLLARVGD